MRSLAHILVALACLSVSALAVAQGPLRLPVDGDWVAVQGPPCSMGMGGHCATGNQQFALDLVPYDRATGQILNCLGAPIVSPTDGTVVAVYDGLPNQPPGTKWGQPLPGNHVVIKRGPGEFVLLAHFSPNTIVVTLNQTVQAGQPIGQCGNTGNSDFPHLHVHMQSTPYILNIMAPVSQPMFFGTFGVRPNAMIPCRPVKGQQVFRNTHLC